MLLHAGSQFDAPIPLVITGASNQGQVKFVSGAGPRLALRGFGDVFE
jgi:hypothetical protein